MKVRLKGYFSVGGEMIPKNTCYVGVLEDLPDWVQKEVEGKSPMIEVTKTPEDKKASSLTKAEIEAQEEAEKAEKAEKAEAEKAEAEKAEAEKAEADKKPSRLASRKPGDK